MIISHSKQFIFFKPAKVAGTSIELALAQHCSFEDIVTPLANLNPSLDDKAYTVIDQNSHGFYEHMTPREIKRKLSKQVWNDYKKITIIRNPWDMVVSRWSWMKHQIENPQEVDQIDSGMTAITRTINTGTMTMERVARSFKYRMFDRSRIEKQLQENDFESFAKQLPEYWTNDQYYFHSQGVWFDTALRFENLQKEYEQLCNELAIESSELPRAKSKIRKEKVPLEKLYTTDAKKAIRTQFARQIEKFDYTFEKK